jgi:hypothetical protein
MELFYTKMLSSLLMLAGIDLKIRGYIKKSKAISIVGNLLLAQRNGAEGKHEGAFGGWSKRGVGQSGRVRAESTGLGC